MTVRFAPVHSTLAGLAATVAASLVLGAAVSASAQLAPDGSQRQMEKNGWSFIALSDDTLVYMRDAPVAPKSTVRQVWTAYDSLRARDREGFAFRSVASLGEYDCAGKKSRTVKETFYSAPSLAGKTWVMPNFIATPWAEAQPGSIGEIRIAYACRERDQA